ncbi:excisionase family protein [Salmonella enterica]|nr:excisionase family protein [Salmonella enterica]EHM8724992.1 excisionase family protein [Salmonella enterica]EKE5542554.1 excisionase family protein [Salmonella enterica]HBJ6598159.1 excisionase family protein [Salmonella enterica subsp. enterica serovar Havana]
MAQVIFNEEWIVERKLSEKTGLSKRQIKEMRAGIFIEGVHFKRCSLNGKETQRGLTWYNYPRINQLVQES